MSSSRAIPALGLLGVFLFLAWLSLEGPIVDPVGRHQRFFALVVNGMIDRFGETGSAGVFAVAGLLLGGIALWGGRSQ